MPADEEMVAFRLAANDRKAIRRLVESGEFRNRSDFFRHAVKTTLERYEGKPRLDLDIEGVDLPAHASGRQKPRGRQSKGVNL
ncbi:MAG TPA: ribbon-helix-helix domain-containing protein [Candidatus Thermoplasmatota archaeon]|nr:ribbon-helix-helix domain-containing protein [Candidatus Thermoplasmatota archaeon]